MEQLTIFLSHASAIWLDWVVPMSWQVALLIGVLFCVTLLARKASPRFRYFVWCLVLAKLCLPPSIAFVAGVGRWLPVQDIKVAVAPIEPIHATEHVTFDVSYAALEPTELSNPAATVKVPVAPPLRETSVHISWPQTLFSIWIVGVLGMAGVICAGYWRISRRLARCRPIDDPEVLTAFRDARTRLGVQKKVDLVASPDLASPILFGLLRPRIIIPLNAIQKLSEEQLQPILLHELAHLQRRDLWVNWMQVVLQTFYWFHPFVWFANMRLRREREMIVDDIVLTHLEGGHEAYGASLLSILKQAVRRRMVAPGYIGIMETRKNLVHRVRRIADSKRSLSTRLGWLSAALVIALGLILIPQARGKDEAPSSPDGKLLTSNDFDDAKGVPLSGKVTDSEGNPVAAAEVQAYSVRFEKQGLIVTPIGSAATKEDGAFSFIGSFGRFRTFLPEGAIIVARKDGFSLGWSNGLSSMPRDMNLDIQLGPPHRMAGVVTDENGKPVANAEVRVELKTKTPGVGTRRLYARAPCDWTVVKTDAKGAFSFANIPENATAEFLVQAKGYAQFSTRAPGARFGQFMTDQSDIKIVLPKEAVMEGRVIDTKTRKSVPHVQLVFMRLPKDLLLYHSCTSNADGRFRVGGLSPGQYAVKLVPPEDTYPSLVAKPLSVDVQAREIRDGVILEVSQGLALKVTVLDEDSKAPIGDAMLGLTNPSNGETLMDSTDEEGVVRFSLAAGEYQIGGVYHADYVSQLQPGEKITLVEGKPASVTVTLKRKPGIKGKVLDREGKSVEGAPVSSIKGKVLDTEGKPVEGATVSFLPMQQGRDVKTDAAGEFAVPWEPLPQMDELGIGPMILVRDMKRNLAAISDVEDPSKPINVTLKPAVSITGKVVDAEGRAIPKARVLTRKVNMPGIIGQERIMSDTEGMYEIKTIPLGQKYRLRASADGYGIGHCTVYAASASGQHIEVDTITLQLANLSVSGKVLNAEGKPVANAPIIAYSQGQSLREATSDKDGKFSLNDVCKGQLQITAFEMEGGTQQRYGITTAQGGAKDVVVVVRYQTSAEPGRPTPPTSLVGNSLPDVAALGEGTATE